MKRISVYITVSFLWFFVGVNAQQLNKVDANGWKQGSWKKYYESNKALFYEGQFKDDKPTGTFHHYYKNGKLRSVTRYDGDTARSTVFTQRGALLATGKFINQKKDSIWVYFNPNGNISQKETYFDGVKTGLEETYFPDGTIASKIDYINDVENGSFVMFYANGSKESEGEYVNGQYNGNFIYYYDNGKKMYEGNYLMGRKDGRWVYYQSDGLIKMYSFYNKGITVKENYQNGEFISYFDSGMKESIGHYKDGKKEGYFASFYNNGKRELVAKEKTDPYEPDELIEVITGQQVKMEQTYQNDLLEGETKYYSEDGQLLKIENYEMGVLINK